MMKPPESVNTATMNQDHTLQASEEVEVEGEEAIPARGLPSPTQPTRKEIQEHVSTQKYRYCMNCLGCRSVMTDEHDGTCAH